MYAADADAQAKRKIGLTRAL